MRRRRRKGLAGNPWKTKNQRNHTVVSGGCIGSSSVGRRVLAAKASLMRELDWSDVSNAFVIETALRCEMVAKESSVHGRPDRPAGCR